MRFFNRSPLLQDVLTQHRVAVISGIILSVIGAALVLALGLIIEHVVQKALVAKDATFLNHAAIFLSLLVVFLAAISKARVEIVGRLSERIVADIRSKTLAKLFQMDMPFFEQQKSGDLLARLSADTTLLQTAFDTSFPIFIRNGLIFIGGLILLAANSWQLTAIIFLSLPVMGLALFFFGRQVRLQTKGGQEDMGRLSAYVGESLREIKTVISFQRQSWDIARMDSLIENVFDRGKSRLKARGNLAFVLILMIFAVIAFVLWYGGQQVIQGQMTAGDLAGFLFYAVTVAGAVRSLTDVVGDIQRSMGAMDRLNEVMLFAPTIHEAATPVTPQDMKGKIEFKNVSFSYPWAADKKILENIHLTLNPSDQLALVGLSGAGKSSFFSLILRLYDVTSGEVLVDGVDVKEWSLEKLRQTIGLVPQDTVIFSDTVFNNIRYAKPGASEAEVIAAAKLAQAWDFIEKLPQGLNTELGEKGVRLSGGEKQRISIARLFLKNPKIVLLDEIATGLDQHHQDLVLNAVSEFCKDKTTLVISHNLALIKSFKKIVVVRQGAISESGTHQSLQQNSNTYQQLLKQHILS